MAATSQLSREVRLQVYVTHGVDEEKDQIGGLDIAMRGVIKMPADATSSFRGSQWSAIVRTDPEFIWEMSI